jgi:DNA-binding PadR family transcriptional regulator
MERLHKKGFISDPVGKAKSVILTEEGQREAERLFAEMFAAAPTGTRAAESATLKLP